MYVYAHDDGFGNCLVPLCHHYIVYRVVTQIGCRCIYACLIQIGQLPVAYAAASLVEDYRVLLCTVLVIAIRIDYMYRNLTLGLLCQMCIRDRCTGVLQMLLQLS